MTPAQEFGQSAFAALRRFTRKRPAAELCELCSTALFSDHEHLIEPASQRIICSCTACAILFSGQPGARYRRVPRDVQFLGDFRLTDPQWEELHLPINLAFFFHSTRLGRVVAVYPSPAGGTESLLTLETWRQLEEENPILRELEPDVEALLVNRLGPARTLSRADRRLLSPRRPDTNRLARPIGRSGSLGRNPAVLRPLEATVGAGRNPLPCLI